MSKLNEIADNIRLALFDKEYQVYVGSENSFYFSALSLNDKIIAGVLMYPYEDDWYYVETLWAESPVAAMAILLNTIKVYKKLLPSKNISPAALEVVKRIYNNYKNTEVVVDNVQEDERPEIAAGYRFSNLIKVPALPVETVSDPEKLKKLFSAVESGFMSIAKDPTKTKEIELTKLLRNKDYKGLKNSLTKLMLLNPESKNSAIQWLKENKNSLSNDPKLRSLLVMNESKSQELKNLLNERNYEDFSELYFNMLQSSEDKYNKEAEDFIGKNLPVLEKIKDSYIDTIVKEFKRINSNY